MRYSIKTLLAVSTLVAVSCAGLIVATPAWAASFFTGAFLLVLASIVAAIVRRGPDRAYWIGFAILANGYFWPAVYVDGQLAFRPDRMQFEEPKLITTHLLMAADGYVDQLRPNRQSASSPQTRSPAFFQLGTRTYMYSGKASNYIQVGQSLFTLLFGLVGGWLGAWFYRRDPGTDASAKSLP